MRRRQPDMRPWRVSLRCRVNSRPISASSSMTISTRSKASGAASKTSPTAPHSKVLIGSPPGIGTSDGRTACGPSSSSAPMRMARPRSSCRLPSRRSLASSGCAGSARSSATTTRRFWRATFRSAFRPNVSSPPGVTCVDRCSATRGCATIGSSWRRCRKWSAPRPIRSCRLDVTANASGAHLDPTRRRLGEILFRQALVGDAPARPRQAPAHVGIRRSPLRHRHRNRRRAAHAGDFDRSKAPRLCAPRHSRYFRTAGIARILSRSGVESENPPSLPHQPRRSRRRTGRRRISRIVFGDCYYHVLASYEDDAAVSHYGPGALHLRELLAHAIKLGLRRFDFTIGDEPYKDEWSDTSIKLYDHSAAATWRGWPVSATSTARRRLKRFIKQTPAIWRFVSRAACHGRCAHRIQRRRHGKRRQRATSPRRSRNLRSPASWATWTCCSRSRRPAFPAPW